MVEHSVMMFPTTGDSAGLRDLSKRMNSIEPGPELASAMSARSDGVTSELSSIRVAALIDATKNGRLFVLVDEQGRGSLVMPAQMVTPEAINFMAAKGRGLITLVLTERRAGELRLPMMSPRGASVAKTAFTVSIEAREGVSTGISAADRARTIAVAVDASYGPEAIVTPGHVFPIVARDGGVFTRVARAEAAADLMRMAGVREAAVVCEVLNDDGTVSDREQAQAFALANGFAFGCVRDVLLHRMKHDRCTHQRGQTELVANGFTWNLITFAWEDGSNQVTALIMGDVENQHAPHVCVRTAPSLIESLGNHPSGDSIRDAMGDIQRGGAGLIMLLPNAHQPHQTADEVDAELSTVALASLAQVAATLNVSTIRLHPASSRHARRLSEFGLTLVPPDIHTLPCLKNVPHVEAARRWP